MNSSSYLQYDAEVTCSVTSGGVQLRDLTPRLHSFEEASQWRRVVGDTEQLPQKVNQKISDTFVFDEIC